MSSIEPRLNPSQGRNGAPGEPSNGASGTNGSAKAATGGHAAPTVTVAAGVESALAAVQQQLARQAATITLEPPAPAPAPAPAPVAAPPPAVAPAPVVAPRPAPPAVVPAPAPPPARPVAAPVADDDPTLVVAPAVVRRSLDEDDDQIWQEARPRRVRPVVDPDDLTKDERRALGKLKARKVRRIIRHVSPWSVFKVSILFYLCLWMILMVAGVILWKVGQEAGVLTNVEKFYAKASGEKVFEIDGRRVFRAASAAGAILVFAGTGFTVLLAVLFNLITDLTGGIRVSVLELENTRRVLRRGARGENLKAKAEAEAEAATDSDVDALDTLDTRDAGDSASDARSLDPASDQVPAVVARRRTTERPSIEFAADAIVDGRGELESSTGLPARERTSTSAASRVDDPDAAFAPGSSALD
jgi:hypothetical protein